MSGWAIVEDGLATLVHRRGIAPGWDLAETAVLPLGDASARVRRRLAHQVRQDLWRALRTTRGFVPSVEVRAGPDQLTVRAGGRLLTGTRPLAAHGAAIRALLGHAGTRRRWLAHAGRGARGS